MESLPVAVTFLSCERCLGIIAPFYMTKARRKNIGYGSSTILFVLAILLTVFHVVPAFPSDPITECKGFGCLGVPLGQSFYAIERLIIGGINTILLILLAFFVKKKLVTPGIAKKTNLLVLKTLGILLIFDFTPHLVWYVAFTFFDINLTKPFGPFFILAALDAYLCSKAFHQAANRYESGIIQPITMQNFN
uniref:G_PROTEIN_RECEP_F1_2 domain-containing protein n=1 Tax=Panagrellus redivivus TaxID=6233 RepID=A0A7E4ZWQ1_PANRE